MTVGFISTAKLREYIYYCFSQKLYSMLLILYFIKTKYYSNKSACQKYQTVRLSTFLFMQGAYTEKQSDTEEILCFDPFNLRCLEYLNFLKKYLKWSYISCKAKYEIGAGDKHCTLFIKQD